MLYFVNKSFEAETKVKTFCKTLIGTVSRICEAKYHSLRRKRLRWMTFLFPDGNIHLIALLLASEWDAFTGLFEKEPSIKAGQAFTSYRMCVAWADWRRIM